MTTLIVALLLGLIHVSLLATATLVLRACVPRRLAGSRAAIGGVGMACILVVSALAFLPLPSIWPNLEANRGADFDAIAVHNPDAAASNGRDNAAKAEARASNAVPSTDAGPNAGITVSLSWLRRVGDGFRHVTAAAKTAHNHWMNLLIGCLLCGVAVGIGRLFVSLHAMRQLYRTSITIADEHARTMTGKLKRDCGCRRPIELRQTDELASPATFGFFRPVILLPTGWTEWTEEEIAAVLAHEVAHIRRGDFLQRLIARLVEAVYFYHPLVRAAGRRLAADQEFAADRLAGSLRPGEQAYLRGLATLAVRCHESFESDGAGSRLALIPKSSDFLARRLEMLRSKNGSTGKRAERLVSWAAAGSVLAVALGVTLLRGPAVSAEKPADEAAEPVEVARRIAPSSEPTEPAPVKSNSDSQPDASLFAREPFDLSIILDAKDGAFLIRLGVLLQLPELQKDIDTFNQAFAAGLRQWTKNPDSFIDFREIDWIAGSLAVELEPIDPPNEHGATSKIMLGAPRTIIHLVHAGGWQAAILKNVPGSSPVERGGKTYVQLPVLPALGPHSVWLQFPDDRTIVAYGSLTRGLPFDVEKMVAASRPGQQHYAWAEAWRTVDGGLITIVYDNDKLKWPSLPSHKKDCPEFARPLFENVKYYAGGWDLSEKSRRTGVQIQGTCADNQTAFLLQAASIQLKQWPALVPKPEGSPGKYYDRIVQFISSVVIEPSPAEGNQHFVHARAEARLDDHELVDLLRQMFQ